MTAVRFVQPLTPELLALAVLEEGDPMTRELAGQPWFAQQFLAEPALAGAMIGGGRVLAAAGLIRRWHGLAEAWLMLAPELEFGLRAMALHRVRDEMDRRQAEPAFRRIEMHVRAGEPWAPKFGRLMGMRLEGVLRQWDPLGRDYFMFARVATAGGEAAGPCDGVPATPRNAAPACMGFPGAARAMSVFPTEIEGG